MPISLLQLSSPSSSSFNSPLPTPLDLTLPLEEDEEDEDSDDEDVDSLLYSAQMLLIGRQYDQALQLYLQAAEKGSSLGCSTAANLLTRRPTSPSLHPMPSSSTSPRPASSSSSSSRPTLTRQASNAYAHASTSYQQSDASLQATQLWIQGLEIETRKPALAQGQAGKDAKEGEGSDTEDEGSAEGAHFDPSRALDLVVGVCDSLRFGVLHAPIATAGQRNGRKDDKADLEAVNDDLWRRSAAACTALLSHPAIEPLVTSPVAVTSLSSPSRPKSKRRSSVARSFRNAASSIPLPNGLAAPMDDLAICPSRSSPHHKLHLTLAIHALYCLALQAHSASPSPCSSASTTPTASSVPPPPSAEAYWTAITLLASPYIPQGGIGVKEADELVSRAKHRLETASHRDLGAREPWRLAKGRKKVGTASFAEVVRGGAAAGEGEAWAGEAASAVTIRPALAGSVGSASGGSFGGKTPRAGGANGTSKFHFEEEGESEGEGEGGQEEEERQGSNAAEQFVGDSSGENPTFEEAGGSGFSLSLSPPTELLTSPPRPATAASQLTSAAAPPPLLRVTLPSAAIRLAASQQYPSPPETPPAADGGLQLHQSPHALPPSSSLCPPPTSSSPSSSSTTSLARSPIATTDTTSSSTGTSAIPRAHSTYSFASLRSTRSIGGASVLSSFSYNPLQHYLSSRLKRVESSTSVCTAPPEFEAREGKRWSRKEKGKGRAVDGRTEARSSPLAMSATVGHAVVEEGDGEGRGGGKARSKTWLSRFWGSTGSRDLSHSDRSRSSTAVDELKKALERHEEAAETAIDYWGEREFFEDEYSADEEGGGEYYVSVPVKVGEEDEVEGEEETFSHHPRIASDVTIRPTKPSACIVGEDPSLSSATLRPPPAPQRRSSARTAKSKRSFLLNDPTSSPSSSSTRPSSRSSSPTRRSSSRHRHNPSASSTSTYSPSIIDGLLAPPSTRGKSFSVSIDPLLLELERKSELGMKTVCATCGKKGLNFPTCAKCGGTYHSRECRVSEAHPCSAERRARKAATTTRA